MRRQLTGDEYAALLRDFEHTAFRLEIQPEYFVPEERELLAQFMAGSPTPIDEVAGLKEWFAQVRSQVEQGKRLDRVRIHDDPPTDYQRLEMWSERWNVEAGENVRHLTRQHAREIGLLPAAGPHDWWLLDSRKLVIMVFGSDNRLIRRELETDPAAVVQAAVWRDLAIHHSVPSEARHATA
jgi:hypothetical protein